MNEPRHIAEHLDPDSPVAVVRVGASTVDQTRMRTAVADPRAGAVVTFEGVTRSVDSLDYEAYCEMAVDVIRDIATEAAGRFEVCRLAIDHVVGEVRLGDPSVLIMVSAPHRGPAFEAARWILDQLKSQAPIWKVEISGADRRRVDGAVPRAAR